MEVSKKGTAHQICATQYNLKQLVEALKLGTPQPTGLVARRSRFQLIRCAGDSTLGGKNGPANLSRLVILLLGGGGYGYSRYGHRGGIGIGGLLLIVLVLYLLFGYGRF